MLHFPTMLLESENLLQNSVVQLSDVADSLQKRAAAIDAWLSGLGSVEQRRCEEGMVERVYWRYGYMTAVRDALDVLRRNGIIP